MGEWCCIWPLSQLFRIFMKISKLFHWLYFFIMSLPLMVIPIFGIYSHRHTIDSYSVQVEESIVVDFNQLVTDTDFTAFYYGIDVVKSDYYVTFNGTALNEGIFITLFDFDVIDGHQYYLRNFSGGSIDDYNFYILTTSYGSSSSYDGSFIYSPTFNDTVYFRAVLSRSGLLSYNMGFYFNVFDLTQMFGAGNEPSIQQFNSWYPNDYYEYTLSDKQLLNSGNYITYDNTDIGSQLTYAIYTPLHDYYNFNNFSTFNDVYNWIQLTFFNGNAPLGFFIVWECICYWLMISIFWLIFDIFLYVPMLAHRWLDKASLS